MATVVLTGASGNLGTYLLACLAQQPEVDRIICLNRSSDLQIRQQKLLAERGLLSKDSGHTATRARDATHLKCDFAQPKLGLADPDYRDLQEHATHILHCAWPVDWNKSFASFRPAIQTVTWLIDLAREGRRRPLLFFISSQAAAGNWGSVPGAQARVPEREIDDWKVARFGYGQSKLVAERLLADAARRGEISAAVCRIGQLSGPVEHDEHGVWPPQEWLPSLITSSQYLKLLPRSLGPLDAIDWVPIDVAARIVVELLFGNPDLSSAAFYHIVNPQSTQWQMISPVVHRYLGDSVKLVSLDEWVDNLEASSVTTSAELVATNPSIKLLSFFQNLREKAVYLPRSRAPTLDVKHTIKSSKTLASLQAVDTNWMSLWMRQWGYQHGDNVDSLPPDTP